MTQQQPQTNRAGSFALQLGWFYDRVDFLGFPDLRDKKPLSLDRIFVPLRFVQRIGDENRISLEQLLSENRQVVILGDPGAGKSTIVKYVVTMLSRSQENPLQKAIGRPIPIPIILRDYQRAELSTLDSILARFIELHQSNNTPDQKDYVGSDITVDWLKDEMRSGNAFLLFDGLDEVGTADDRKNLGHLVLETIESYPNCWFLLTSRIVGYEEAPIHLALLKKTNWAKQRGMTGESFPFIDVSGFPTFFVAPFQENDINEFVTRWYEAREPDPNARRSGVVSFRQALEVNDRVRRLASNPSLLTLMALVHRITANLPSGRVKLYEKIVEAYLETLQSFKKMSRPASLDDMKQWLGRIGWEMQASRSAPSESEGVVAPEKSLLEWIRKEIDVPPEDSRPGEFLEYVKRRSGLLVERGPGMFAFVHLTFQEYFAAYWLEITRYELSDLIPDLTEKVKDRYWHETFCILLELFAQYKGKGEKIVRAIMNDCRKFEHPSLREFLATVATDAENGLKEEIREEMVAYALEEACRGFNENINRHLAGMPEQFQSLVPKWFSMWLKPGTNRVLTTDFLLTGRELIGEKWAVMLNAGVDANGGSFLFDNEETKGIFSLCGMSEPEVFRWSVKNLKTTTWFRPISGGHFSDFCLAESNTRGLLKSDKICGPFLAELTGVFLFQGTIHFRFALARTRSLALARALEYALNYPHTLTQGFLKRTLIHFFTVPLDRALGFARTRVVDLSLPLGPTLDRGRFHALALELQPVFQSENHEALGFFDPNGTESIPLAAAILAERSFWDVGRFETQGQRVISDLRELAIAEDDWTRIVGLGGLFSLGYGTPELFNQYDALIVKGITRPNDFTFREDLREETDSEKFRKDLPELFQLVFTRYPDEPDTKWLVPKLFDPETPGSEWFLAKPPQFREMIEKLAAEKG